ncbi:MAG: PilZ domain-containing protein [Treponema sp.]|nr:PilZ domain-containing protein [Treponema sp.]
MNHRSHIRYRTYAKVKFRGILEQESILKDISITGCRVECTSLADIHVGSTYTLEVIPESSSRIGHFDLEVTVVWISMAGYSGDVGFSITASPKGKLFQRYVDYLSWKGSHE